MAFIENFIGNLLEVAATDSDRAGGDEPAEEAQLWVCVWGRGKDQGCIFEQNFHIWKIYTPGNDTWVGWPHNCSSIWNNKAFELADGTTCKNDNNHQCQLHNLPRKPTRHFSVLRLKNVQLSNDAKGPKRRHFEDTCHTFGMLGLSSWFKQNYYDGQSWLWEDTSKSIQVFSDGWICSE